MKTAAIIVIILAVVLLALVHHSRTGTDPAPNPPGQTEHQKELQHVNDYCDQLAARVPGYHCVHSGVRVEG